VIASVIFKSTRISILPLFDLSFKSLSFYLLENASSPWIPVEKAYLGRKRSGLMELLY